MKINEKTLFAFANAKPVDKEGYLSKRGEVNKSFQRRWFVLKGNLLFYFEKKGGDLLGMIILEGCVIELAEAETEKYCFNINFHGNRTYILSADDQDTLEAWMKALTCSGFDYMRLMISELQRQLEELDKTSLSETENYQPPVPPRGRQNPFNKFNGTSAVSSNQQVISNCDVVLRPAPPPPCNNRTNMPENFNTVRFDIVRDDNEFLMFEAEQPDDFSFEKIHEEFEITCKGMLPSTGLFRNIPCPYFEEGNCQRPFCHFKHDFKKEETLRPSYHATPITSKPELPIVEETIKKKPRLEYRPIPTLKALPNVTYKATVIKSKENSDSYVPPNGAENTSTTVTYVPTRINSLVELPDDSVTTPNETDCNGSTETPVYNETEQKNDIDEIQKKTDSEKTERHSKSSSSKQHRSSSKSSRSDSKRHKSSRSDHHKDSSTSHKHKSSKHKSSKSSREKSSGSSKHLKESSSDRKHKSSKDKEKEIENKIAVQIINMEEHFPSSDEDDDIEQECLRIFESYNPHETKEPPPQPKPSEETKPVDEPQVNDKKRQAHEKAVDVVRPTIHSKPNHTQSALLSVQQRQDLAIRNVIADRKAKDEEIAKIEAEIKEKEQEQLTPLINPLLLYRPPRRPAITPISQRMAIEAAKRKVAELNKAKEAQFQRFTPAQTAAKTAFRVAHVPSSLTSDIDQSKLAPPIKEPQSSKISSNIRNQYYQIMVRHCLQIYPLSQDAFERAQSEEFIVFQKCMTAQTYKPSVLLAINRLKKEIDTEKNAKMVKTISHDVILAGKMGQKSSWSTNHKVKVADSESSLVTIDNCSSSQAYNLFFECNLNEAQLKENGYPRPAELRGRAQLFTPKKAKPQNGKKGDYYCARCHTVFNVNIYEEEQVDLCNFHLKRSGFRRGFADNLYYCCQQPSGTSGCCYANYHVTDYIDHDNLIGYVTTMERDEDYVCTKKDIFALDCEMCYTISGLELTRITVVNFDEQIVYDKFVKPQNRIIDYNTRFSGISESTLSSIDVKSLPEIQAVLLSMFHSRTILVGHSLESDLKALKLIHSVVVDTSVLYPHKMGPPKKKALKTLCIDNLKKIIQEEDAGHDSAEDALVCIQLVKCYLRNRIVN